MLNGKGGPLNIAGLPDSNNVGRYLAIIAGRGVEGAIANTLEDKNASLGFWSGTLSGIGGMFSPAPGTGSLRRTSVRGRFLQRDFWAALVQ